MRFIYRTVFVVLIFFICYSVLLTTITVERNQSQNFRQKNKIKAENFIFSKTPYETIIVGSSMSEGLLLNSKKKNLTLNFIGGSSLTGLELIKNVNLLPKTIVIETNWLERSIDDDLITKPKTFSYALKSIFPFLLEKNQPVNIITDYLAPPVTAIKISKTQPNLDKIIEINVTKENRQVNPLKTKSSINLVKSYIQYFLNKGVKIYLMEMPVDPKFYLANRSKTTRIAVSNTIYNIPYIPSYPNAFSLKTIDGYHLFPDSKKEYSDFLIDFLNRNK